MSLLAKLAVLAVAELLALVAVAERIGPLDAIGLLVLVSLCGPALVRRSGVSGLRHSYRVLRGGASAAGDDGLDVVLRLTGAALVCIPGFITDVVGLALWVPPVRAVVRRRVAHRQAELLVDRFGGPPPGTSPTSSWPGGGAAGAGGRRSGEAGPVIDAASHPVDPDRLGG